MSKDQRPPFGGFLSVNEESSSARVSSLGRLYGSQSHYGTRGNWEPLEDKRKGAEKGEK